MPERYQIAIIGAGPAGLSAAAHAAELGTSHVLLERSDHLADTIYQYQKGKHVMAEPGKLPLRSPMHFAPGTREEILSTWEKDVNLCRVNMQFNCEVTHISPQANHFLVSVRSADTIEAERIIFAIGLQGNVRKLGVEGEDLPFVIYTLADPDEYHHKTIVIVGAGDAAIENALALAKKNQVIIVNRRDEFTRAKEANNQGMLKAIEAGHIECFYNSSVESVCTAPEHVNKAGVITLNTPKGRAEIPCDIIIARLGAIPPRRLVESCGIEFPSDDPRVLPNVDAHYESNVKGLYIIGALGGYPLIKQALNQGYEAVEFAMGRQVELVDQPLLHEKFKIIPNHSNVESTLAYIQKTLHIFSAANALIFRDLVLDSQIVRYSSGQTIFKKNDYTNSFFSIISGRVRVLIDEESHKSVILETGDFFGEMSLISGRRRTATVVADTDSVLLETPQRSMNKLIRSDETVASAIDEIFIIRAIQSIFAPNLSQEILLDTARQSVIQKYRAGETLFEEGDEADALHLIRTGSVTVSRNIGGKNIILSYVASGNYVGEMGVIGNIKRTATVRAAVSTETIKISKEAFKVILDASPELKARIQANIKTRLKANAQMALQAEGGDIISFLMQQGLGEATDVLLIDETLCIGCDNCEKACAETHQGTSRLDRRAGPTYAQLHVPTSCRHCEHPHCMKDCPPDAIHRSPSGEVYIDESCIGCGNCERHCPYGVIHMAYPAEPKPPLWQWLLFGLGPGPGEIAKKSKPTLTPQNKVAVKCDMCKNLPSGPACVRACPTGAAVRINPDQFVQLAETKTILEAQ